MIQKVKAPVSICSIYNHKKRLFFPKLILWEGLIYKAKKIGYHHTFCKGKTLFHVFSVLAKCRRAGDTHFKLVHDTGNLSWEVAEISDGEAD